MKGKNKMIKDQFIQAIHSKKKLRITYFSKQDRGIIVRKCAPMDYGPSRRSKLKNDLYHLWNFDDSPAHTMSLNPEQISKLEILDEIFNPAIFVTRDTSKSKWFVPRDWGSYS
jgi:hypothetical protein